MTHIDLFSGICGFAYAAQQVWGNEYENLFFCENNRFCQEVIKKNFGKDSLIYGDIREVAADTRYGRQEKQKQQTTGNKQCDRSVGLLTGGFPCQPFSVAGKRRGTQDDRYLWPEMLRVIKDFKPRWIIAENVKGLINIQDGVVFQQVYLDLENANYEVQPFIIPACAVDAPHRRDRVWIVAHTGCEYRFAEKVKNVADSKSSGQQGGIDEQEQEQFWGNNQQPDWEKGWYEVAIATCDGRMDDGLPVVLDGLKLTKAWHRVERLKALGNAIVPQVAAEIMRAIKYAEERSYKCLNSSAGKSER